MKPNHTTHEAATMLQTEQLHFSHPGQAGPPLFKDFCLALPAGVSWLTGDEGSGKTTLLQLLAGELPAAGGQLRVQSISLSDQPLAYRQKVVWFNPRDTALDQQTARQVLARLPAMHPSCALKALALHIEGLSLGPHLGKALYMMSTGTRRKVLLAAALAAGGTATLLDQPFMALDRPSINYLLDLLATAARSRDRAWLVADYEAPNGVALASIIRL